jgi:hypothetical protein
VRPGFLTQEFLRGRRARYLPPFRLYLVVSLFFFVVLAAFPDDSGRLIQIGPPGAPKVVTPGERAGPPDVTCEKLSYHGPARSWVQPRLTTACHHAVQDRGRELGREFLHNVPRTMFVFLPLLAGIMMLLYWRPRRFYIEHLLFLVHNHAFVFLFVGMYILGARAVEPLYVSKALSGGIEFGVFAYLVWYLYTALRRVYGNGRRRTLAKFVAIGFAYFVCGLVMIVMTAFVSALGL